MLAPAFLALLVLAGVAGRVAVADEAVEAAAHDAARAASISRDAGTAESAARTAARRQLDWRGLNCTSAPQVTVWGSTSNSDHTSLSTAFRRPPASGESSGSGCAARSPSPACASPGCRWATNGSRPPSAPRWTVTGAGSDRAPDRRRGPGQPLPRGDDGRRPGDHRPRLRRRGSTAYPATRRQPGRRGGPQPAARPSTGPPPSRARPKVIDEPGARAAVTQLPAGPTYRPHVNFPVVDGETQIRVPSPSPTTGSCSACSASDSTVTVSGEATARSSPTAHERGPGGPSVASRPVGRSPGTPQRDRRPPDIRRPITGRP